MTPFRSYEHLLRLAALFAAGIGLFLLVRWLLVPEDYGRLGPYRASAVTQNQVRSIAYAGQLACIECHSDVAETRKPNAHARLSCEGCHGPHALHAADTAIAARKPDGRDACAVCHRPDVAKPRTFKTVNLSEHAGAEACISCHPPHAPRF